MWKVAITLLALLPSLWAIWQAGGIPHLGYFHDDGIYAGTAMTLGRTALLRIGGMSVVVTEGRAQCADPVFFEHLGLDIGKARAVVVKSRGHFRGGFDEFFGHDQIVEVDCPGLTSPILTRFAWKRLPRPVLPIDSGVEWTPS